MEALFENHYKRDKEMLREVYGYYFFRRRILIILYAALFICFVAEIFFAVLAQEAIWRILVIAPLVYLMQLGRYFLITKTTLKREKEIWGRELEVETVVTDEFVQNTASSGAVVKLEWDKFKSAVKTKNFILLYSGSNLFLVFKRNGFTKGTAEDFVLFLKKKGIKLS